jgi:hypothetical protein
MSHSSPRLSPEEERRQFMLDLLPVWHLSQEFPEAFAGEEAMQHLIEGRGDLFQDPVGKAIIQEALATSLATGAGLRHQRPIQPTKADLRLATLAWAKQQGKTEQELEHLTDTERAECSRLAQAYTRLRLIREQQ